MNFKTEKDKYIFSKICRITNEIYTVSVDGKKYEEWRNGPKLIQNVFPELPREQREFLITGNTPEEWNNIFTDI